MNKIFSFLIKLIPLLTLYKGLTTGGERFSPIFNVGKFAFTQYELGQVANTLMNFYKENDRFLIAPKELSRFIQKKYTNRYSRIARNVLGGDPENLSLDLWGENYEMKVEEDGELVILYSQGPDGTAKTKDDIAIDFRTQGASSGKLDIHAHEEPNLKSVVTETVPIMKDQEAIRDRARGGYDSEGFDEEGFNRDGFDRSGFDRDGYNKDGLSRDEI